MSTYGLNNRGKGSGRGKGAQAIAQRYRGAQAIVEKDRDTKKPESRPSVSGGKGQGRSPMSVYQLRKLADNKMTEGNPNIANLGDPNRPTKIAEIFSEIYDNEWTDTFDFCLEKFGKEYSEDDVLQALNKTLIICYKICQEKSDEWMQKTKEVLQRCSHELMVDIQSDEILMQIKKGRKEVSDQMSQQLLKEIRPMKDIVATKYAKEMSCSKLYKMIIQNKFFEKCFTLCWKMIVQNPRMILVEGPSKGETYDRNIFREFTSGGSKVIFTVWPALYLHKDGPLLVKGVLKVE